MSRVVIFDGYGNTGLRAARALAARSALDGRLLEETRAEVLPTS